MRRSKAFIPTTKEAPSDATLPSHIFLSRAGFITQVAAGLYNYLPLAKRVIKKIENIINEEMTKIGAQEVELSFVTPAELWQESGRIEKFGKELLRFHDRKNNLFVLGPTHEEMMVDVVRNRVTSYKNLPLNLYQIKTKFRDEARPRFGLMRGREFIMKDGYSFHATTEDLDREFDTVEEAYKKILTRLGLDFRIVEADSGAIGGSGSKELMVLADSGEDTIAVCSKCEYGANIEAASRSKRSHIPEAPEVTFNKFKTPDVKTIDELAEFFKIDPYYTIKCIAKRVIYEDESEIVLFFVRGCDNLQEVKAVNATEALDIVDVTEEELKEIGLVPGFIGPLDQDKAKHVIDSDLKDAKDMICGANEAGYHYIGVDLSVLSDVAYFEDIAEVNEGDICPHCEEGTLSFTKGIEVGHIFKLGTTYSEALKAEFLDENGKAQPFIMGTYGMGVSRMVAAVIEQHHDDNGCIWTKATAPYMVNIMISNIKDEAQVQAGEKLYKQLQDADVEVMLDDRKERFGFKMKDAELIGFPYTIVIGKELVNGHMQIFERVTKEKTDIKSEEIFNKIMELV
ncbi:proline--tRNA ligase [Sulfurimonas autotrophica]|uniref:Proline--tRNA ligase n=1 Tax=Sulfurimonas autotrophica (strain ATCC BAA-671 / DSM 16294 / JCM 11897 / OK10) TaxID=563040 RepID=E0URL1_SULAO|nr:proline--tRNA ligase [Sulfurimonas autotrophica]ADN08955.1 prolyl-tRNA synthetase [Sulfurimonas autotrophica DSM 16294]